MGTEFKLRNGSLLLITEAPGGIYNSDQLKKLAALADGESAIVKATEDQRLALFVREEHAPGLAQELKDIGLGIRHYQDGLHQPISCIGELCPDYQQDALGTAMQLTASLSSLSLDSPLKIGINGCAKCCVPCHTLDISLIGDEGGYRISLGGKNSQLPEMATFMAEGVPASEVSAKLQSIVELYQELAEPGESLQEVMDRAGSLRFAELLKPYSQDAAAESLFTDKPAEEELEEDALALEAEEFASTNLPASGEGEGLDLLEENLLENSMAEGEKGSLELSSPLTARGNKQPEEEFMEEGMLNEEDPLELSPLTAESLELKEGASPSEGSLELEDLEEEALEKAWHDTKPQAHENTLPPLASEASDPSDHNEELALEDLSLLEEEASAPPPSSTSQQPSSSDPSFKPASQADLSVEEGEELEGLELEEEADAHKEENEELLEEQIEHDLEDVQKNYHPDTNGEERDAAIRKLEEVETQENRFANSKTLSGNFKFAGLQRGPQGELVLSFQSGAILELEPSWLLASGQQQLQLGDHILRIGIADGIISLELDDGLTMRLPQEAA